MRRSAIVTALLFCAAIPSAAEAAEQESFPSAEAAARAAVVEDLIDPESARITIERLVDPDPKAGGSCITACGTVNAKNRMGGYTGAVPFRAMVLRIWG